MLNKLKKRVWQANRAIVEHGLVVLTWGNASAIDRETSWIVIKPSGVAYEKLTSEDMVVVDIDGNVVEGHFSPSSDLLTHLELYRQFADIGGIVHTHSTWATSFAQAEQPIPCFGTTHADYFYGTIPCTRLLTKEETETDYEWNTGKVIVETIKNKGLDANTIPGILVSKHGPFVWGKTIEEATENAVVLEETAHMALNTLILNAHALSAPQYVIDKHYFRKHGADAYYGQNSR